MIDGGGESGRCEIGESTIPTLYAAANLFLR